MRQPSDISISAPLFTEGYRRAVELLYRCSINDGFLASPTENANYRRVWGRDGIVIGLAALASGEQGLIDTFRRTLETLSRYQGPHGEIPSNVDTTLKRISYGGTTGRVDANLWFIIGCGEYWKASGDDAFIQAMLPSLEKVRFLLGSWEFNNRGLLYVPQTGDWADEYIHSGYVLYDQLLYLQAQRTIAEIHAQISGSSDHAVLERINRLRHLIRANYWFAEEGVPPDEAYHEVIYRKGLEAARLRLGNYWMPFFMPSGYGYRFDAFANVLASLLDVSDNIRRDLVDDYIGNQLITPEGCHLLPAFWPVIEPKDEDWNSLLRTFSFTFRNNPFEYHNGGRWPMITGFYVAALAAAGKHDLARRFLAGIHEANRQPVDGEPWGFTEFIHGSKLVPGGNAHQGWSAAAAVIGHHALQGDAIFRIKDHE